MGVRVTPEPPSQYQYLHTKAEREYRAKQQKHEYPSRYQPGMHWAVDEAWKILDHLSPNAMSKENRFLLAGMIAGTLMKCVEPE